MTSTVQVYDKAAREGVTANRNVGPAASLKRFHNATKRAIIEFFLDKDGALVLDLCSGRLGDLYKFRDARAAFVHAVDNSKTSLDEGFRRYQKAEGCRTVFSFQEADLRSLGRSSEKQSKKKRRRREGGGGSSGSPSGRSLGSFGSRAYSHVQCMFALHYFASSRETLLHFLQTVAENLAPKGVFYGIASDGDRVCAQLRDRGALRTSLFSVSPQADETSTRPFGACSPYSFSLADTVVQEGTVEFALCSDMLQECAAEAGLVPFDTLGSKLDRYLEEAKVGDLRPLRPEGTRAYATSEAEAALCSSFYSAFAFQKKSGGKKKRKKKKKTS
jgi:mRNA (guanine-N7-)-methyltransferase